MSGLLSDFVSSKWCSVILFPGCLPLFLVPAFLLALTSVSFQSFWAIEATRPRNMPKASKTRKNIRCFATIDSDISIYQSPPKRKMTKKMTQKMCHSNVNPSSHGDVTGMADVLRIPRVAFAGTGTGSPRSPRSPVTGDDDCRRRRQCIPAQQTWTDVILYRLWTNYEEIMNRLCILVTYSDIYIVFNQILQWLFVIVDCVCFYV